MRVSKLATEPDSSIPRRASKGVDTEYPNAVCGFANKAGCNYPRFLYLAWRAILEKDGTPKPSKDIDVDAVACIRQVSHLFYKLELPFTESQINSTIEAFKQAEIDVKGQEEIPYGPTEVLLNRARKIVCRLLAGVNPLSIQPKHGSGSSACGVAPHKRYDSFRYIKRLDAVYPYDEYFYFNKSHLVDELYKLADAEEAEPPAKVVLVPKDSRGPRLISEEPREFMYIQQGLMKAMYDRVNGLPAIRGQIGFTDQTRNQRLARLGSRYGTYATLDLKEASDRVSWKLVQTLFPPNWIKALGATRSLATKLPNGELISLSKFAPMGSACCFPVESICFWSIALAACGCDDAYINRLYQNRLTAKDISISVFGDDIIVPTRFYEKVTGALEAVGLIVNSAKSFSVGSFRESCGGDYVYGQPVMPIRCKALPHNDWRSRFRWAEMLNNIIRLHGYDTVGLACADLYKDLYGPVPISSRYRESPDLEKTSTGLYLIGLYTDVPSTYKRRWNKRLQRLEHKVPCMEARPITVELDGWSHVLRKSCLKLHEVRADRLALPKRYRIKYRWITL
jgi:hypothetical protein